MALAEHKSECEREDKAKTELGGATETEGPQRDFSLKEGEKIKINIGAVSNINRSFF